MMDLNYILSKRNDISMDQWMKPGIYFLINENEIVYIGKARHPYRRIPDHKYNGISFDSVFILNSEKDKLTEIEKQYITHYKPKYNKMHNLNQQRGETTRLNMHLYIAPKDKPEFERFREIVAEKGKSMSELFIQLLRQWERRVTK